MTTFKCEVNLQVALTAKRGGQDTILKAFHLL